ncbi:MAG: C25 family cysteine peptidase [Ignavibacteriaceae bacterium]
MINKLAALLFIISLQIFPQQITLSDTTNQFDYIIITIPEYVQSCQQFKEHKETIRDLKTLIVDTTQIFAEFNSDSLPQNNIRKFISYAGSYWQEPRPEFILLVGTVTKIPNFLVPTSASANPYGLSDYDYMYNINNTDTTEISFLVGRVPAKNLNEIENYFSKVIKYENITEPQPWMNNTFFILQQAYNYNYDFSIDDFSDLLPPYIIPYYISNADTSIYYGNKDTIISRINNEGASVVWFLGHGSLECFILPEYFCINDLNEMENAAKYFVSMFIPVQGAIMDTNTSLTNEMLFLQDAGSLAGFATVGLTYWHSINVIFRYLMRDIYTEKKVPLGKLLSLPELNGGTYYKIKKSLNLWGDPSIILNYSTVTSVDNDILTVPDEFSLSQNYPNPFNPSTKIKYTVPSVETLHANRSATNATSLRVTLKAYDVLGKEIATLVNEEKPAGIYEVEFNASGLSSGIYFYNIQAGSFNQVKKMILLR